MGTNHERSNPKDREDLIAEIVKELEKDALKKEVIAKLQESPKKCSFLQILQHPILLLILGFLLTAIVGNRLASRWQMREWERQQERLVQLRKVEVKYGLVNDVVKSYAASFMATHDVFFHVFQSQGVEGELDDKEKQQKLKHLVDSIPGFTNNFGIVRTQLSIYFKDPHVRDLYNVMIGNILNAGYKLHGLQWYYRTQDANRGKPAEFLAKYGFDQDAVAKALSDANNQLAQLIQLMNDEIQADIAGRPVKP